MKKLLTLTLSVLCCSLFSNTANSSNNLQQYLESLYKNFTKSTREVARIDWRHNRVFLKNENDSESLGEKELNKLKGSSFVPSHKKVVKVDSEKELVYYEKD